MELLLPFRVSPSAVKISYSDKICFIGSCFTEEIGRQMQALKFDVLQNPNGILYDPLSISSALVSYTTNKQFNESDLFLLNELWHSWQHHSVFSGIDQQNVLANINRSQTEAHNFLKEAEWLVITAGTSYSYSLKKTSEPVANCHKAPRDFFDKKLLPVEEIISSLSNAVARARSFNPKLKIIFTISPVRHVRDGVIENNRSKGRLIEAIHSITEKLPGVFYFPADELVIDVLRDYRFYKDDLVHPSDAATTFVFDNFCNAFFSDGAKKIMEEIKAIVSAMHHKPFQAESAAHKKFMKVQLEKIKKLKIEFPFIDFSEEEKYFSG
jgi:hypothetical protein